jgi:hypothetical protein
MEAIFLTETLVYIQKTIRHSNLEHVEAAHTMRLLGAPYSLLSFGYLTLFIYLFNADVLIGLAASFFRIEALFSLVIPSVLFVVCLEACQLLWLFAPICY